MFACPATDDFFRARIDQMIDLRHPLAVLASRMPWQELEARVAHLFGKRPGNYIPLPTSSTNFFRNGVDVVSLRCHPVVRQ